MVAERRPNTWVARSVIVMRETEGAIIKLKDIIAAVADAYPEEAGRVRRKPNRSGRDPLTGTISRELWDAANGYVPGFEFVKSGGAAFPGCYFLQGSASSSARLHEEDFNARTAEENRKTVTTSWTNPPKAPPTKGKLPADARYGLNTLCQAAEEELTAIQQDEDDIYFHDTHYDAHLTWLWARLMQQLAQLTTSGRTQECAHPEPVEQMIY